MSRTQTMVQLTSDLVARLDRLARSEGRSRSQLIREAIELYLAADRERAIDDAMVEGYSRAPQGGEFDEDAWGNLGSLTDALALQMLKEVDADERSVGFGPW